MIQKIFHTLLATRHPWRQVGFSELSEMYLAAFLRTIAMSMVGIFIPVYLLNIGYLLPDVLLFYGLFYLFGVFNHYIGAYLIARFGPKHVMRTSFLLQIIVSLLLIDIQHIPYPIITIAWVASAASALYFLPYHIDFSKIKHKKYGGKELGFLQFMERTALIVGPIGGGILAATVSPQATFWAAAVAMLIATVILMLTPEPVRTHQKIRFNGLHLKKEWRDYTSYGALCIENATTIWLWPIYLAAVVFAGGAYIEIGGVASFSVFIAVLVAVPLGKLLDKQKGRAMIAYGTAVNAGIHISRLLVHNLGGAMVVASANEPTTLVYRMAYLKGFYDSADDHPGFRITYIALHEMIGDGVRAIFFLTLMCISLFTTAYIACAVGFVIAVVATFTIRLERFKAL